jgi:hypothetical protein
VKAKKCALAGTSGTGRSFLKATSVSVAVVAGPCPLSVAQDPQPAFPVALFPLPPAAAPRVLPPNTMLVPIPREAKRQVAQTFMMFSPLGVRDLLNVMAHKAPVRPGLSVDEVAAAVIARAEKHGFLLVNRYQMWKELQARTGGPEPYKVEVISIC